MTLGTKRSLSLVTLAICSLFITACSNGPSAADELLKSAKSEISLVGQVSELSVTDSDSNGGTCDSASMHVKVVHGTNSAYLSESASNLISLIKLLRSREEYSGFGLYYNGVTVTKVTDKFGNENVSKEADRVDVCFTSYDLKQINLSNSDYLNKHVLEMASYDIKSMLGLE